jgi:NodT family efflux transporter outer membrane factor (OMF) lipoprotein
MRRSLPELRVYLAVLAVSSMAGCAVGPDFDRPVPPASQVFSPQPLPSTTVSIPVAGGDAQSFSTSSDIQADWWALLHSPKLDALIDQAFKASPTIGAARAALRVAQENVAAQRGFFFPTLQASYSPSRTKLAGNQGGSSPGIQGDGSVISTSQGTPASEGGSPPFNAPVIYNFHTAQLTVGFTPDVFGANRRQVEASQAQADTQRFQLEAAYVTLASNIVAAAVQDGQLRQQIATLHEVIDAGAASVELVRRQLKAGYASLLDVAVQESALAQSRQLLPPLQKQFEQNRDLLRALAGMTQDKDIPEFSLDELQLPRELPLSLPSQLVEQRPDVRAAEEQLHAASAQVGVARAARLPQFSIDGSAGGTASHFNQMFWDSGLFFNLAANITQPLFDGGTLRHREYAAGEALRQTAAQYQSTVIAAFQNVADVLQAIHADARALQATHDTVEATQRALELTRRQFEHGYLDRLALINTEQTYRQALLSEVQARAMRLGDSAALFQALGGGWWHRKNDEGIPRDAEQH